jgi:hypothetical protein
MRVFSGESSSPRVSIKLAIRGFDFIYQWLARAAGDDEVVRVAHQIERILPPSTRINDPVI